MKLKELLKKLSLKYPKIYRLLKGGNCKVKIIGGGMPLSIIPCH